MRLIKFLKISVFEHARLKATHLSGQVTQHTMIESDNTNLNLKLLIL